MEADDCNFRRLGASASVAAEMQLGLGAVVLGGGSGVGGCPGSNVRLGPVVRGSLGGCPRWPPTWRSRVPPGPRAHSL